MRVLYTAFDWAPHVPPAGSRSFSRLVADVAAVLASEYRRAVAAERRYDALRRADRPTLVRTGVTSADVALRLFEGFYCDKGGGLR